MIFQAQYDSPIGLLTMTSDGDSLMELCFSDVAMGGMSPSIVVFEETRRWLDCYFGGVEPDFTLRLAPRGTDFQQRVWRELVSIPYGETVSYGDIAQRVGCRSAQAVGGAVGKNPIAIIVPCHRVVGADGSLTGYAYGLERKRQLLLLEEKTNLFRGNGSFKKDNND